MELYVQATWRKLEYIIHPKKSIEFAKTLADDFMESLPWAQNLADLLDITQIDFMAILGDMESFEDLYLDEQAQKYFGENYDI
jgi:hypothetical protein